MDILALLLDNAEQEMWKVYFMEHRPLFFKSFDDMQKYLNGEWSEVHGLMEYERTPISVEHVEYYKIQYTIND